MALNADVLEAVQDVFHPSGSAGVVLPKGWHGRPRDCGSGFNSGTATDDELVLELTGGTRLVFTGEITMVKEEYLLELKGFTLLVETSCEKYISAGSLRNYLMKYFDGSVFFIRHGAPSGSFSRIPKFRDPRDWWRREIPE